MLEQMAQLAPDRTIELISVLGTAVVTPIVTSWIAHKANRRTGAVRDKARQTEYDGLRTTIDDTRREIVAKVHDVRNAMQEHFLEDAVRFGEMNTSLARIEAAREAEQRAEEKDRVHPPYDRRTTA